ncbi:nuclear receptor-interacting protein 2 [Tachysurus ichikawai]
MSESKKREVELRDKAIMRQQRRLKQATQFTHKDSADLLPLDGLKRLGTSKDLCGDAEVKVSINTGCQYNHISSTCCRRLGLKISPKIKPVSESMHAAVTCVQILIGSERVQCSAQVIDDEAFELCLGLQTLLELKCCVDLNSRALRLHTTGEELPFLETPSRSQCHHRDNSKNL